jgi:hypothetical protein
MTKLESGKIDSAIATATPVGSKGERPTCATPPRDCEKTFQIISPNSLKFCFLGYQGGRLPGGPRWSRWGSTPGGLNLFKLRISPKVDPGGRLGDL